MTRSAELQIADLVRRVRETRIKYIHLDTEKILGS